VIVKGKKTRMFPKGKFTSR